MKSLRIGTFFPPLASGSRVSIRDTDSRCYHIVIVVKSSACRKYSDQTKYPHNLAPIKISNQEVIQDM